MSGKLSADERLELWRDWLDGLKKEIGDRHVERGIWREMTDALDAIRDPVRQKQVRKMLLEVRENCPGWNVVASVREFDLKFGRLGV